MKALLDVATQAQDGGRRAALAMHALRESDRAWILRQLPPAQREPLERLLAELKALAIPASPALVQEMLAAAPAAVKLPAGAAAAPPDASASQLDALARLEAAQVARLVQAEPAGLIAQLLNVQHWPWQDALLEQLGVVKRRRVEEVLDTLRRRLRPKAPEALNRTLVTALLARAQAEAPRPVPPEAPIATRTAVQAWPRRWRDAVARRIGSRV
jgi:hypothetical protein